MTNGQHRLRRGLGKLLVSLVGAGAVVLVAAAPASAHVVPSTTVQLAVHTDGITADLVLPTEDLVTAMTAEGLTALVPTDGSAPSAEAAAQVGTYLEQHTAVSSEAGTWSVDVADVAATETQQWGTGSFPAVTATATWTPPAGTSTRAFTLTYDAILHQVVTADVRDRAQLVALAYQAGLVRPGDQRPRSSRGS